MLDFTTLWVLRIAFFGLLLWAAILVALRAWAVVTMDPVQVLGSAAVVAAAGWAMSRRRRALSGGGR
ncbi:MAG: hypothetical protein INR62_07990 [Rhodospirillales bacterium]|nr:hypothetical protein [Acetobacter sp.]